MSDQGRGSSQFLRKCALLLVATSILVGLPDQTTAKSPHDLQFNEFIAFGDSTIDSGWFIHQPPPSGVNGPLWLTAIANGGGKPTTPYGLMVSELLASDFGLTAHPADQPGGGTNYAAGGAQDDAAFINPRAPSTVSQINNYLVSSGGAANSQALYVISSGGNDIKYAKTQQDAGIFSQTQAIAFLVSASDSLVRAIAKLVEAGARFILVPSGYQVVPGDPTYPTSPVNFRTIYDKALYVGLSAQGIHFVPADITPLSSAIGAAPAAFGLQFTLTSEPACRNPSPSTIAGSWAYYCTPELLVSPHAAQTHLWADGEHYTAAGQRILANYYVSLLASLFEACERNIKRNGDEADSRSSVNDFARVRSGPASLCSLWVNPLASPGRR